MTVPTLRAVRSPERSPLRAVVAIVVGLVLTGCARLTIDPTAGAESVVVRTMDVAAFADVTPLPAPDGGPRVYREGAWWLAWGALPLNHPNLSRHLEDTLPPGTVPMNLRTRVVQRWYSWLLHFGTLGFVGHRVVEHRFEPARVTPRER